jgi:hypothetical protein
MALSLARNTVRQTEIITAEVTDLTQAILQAVKMQVLRSVSNPPVTPANPTTPATPTTN